MFKKFLITAAMLPLCWTGAQAMLDVIDTTGGGAIPSKQPQWDAFSSPAPSESTRVSPRPSTDAYEAFMAKQKSKIFFKEAGDISDSKLLEQPDIDKYAFLPTLRPDTETWQKIFLNSTGATTQFAGLSQQSRNASNDLKVKEGLVKRIAGLFPSNRGIQGANQEKLENLKTSYQQADRWRMVTASKIKEKLREDLLNSLSAAEKMEVAKDSVAYKAVEGYVRTHDLTPSKGSLYTVNQITKDVLNPLFPKQNNSILACALAQKVLNLSKDKIMQDFDVAFDSVSPQYNLKIVPPLRIPPSATPATPTKRSVFDVMPSFRTPMREMGLESEEIRLLAKHNVKTDGTHLLFQDEREIDPEILKAFPNIQKYKFSKQSMPAKDAWKGIAFASTDATTQLENITHDSLQNWANLVFKKNVTERMEQVLPASPEIHAANRTVMQTLAFDREAKNRNQEAQAMGLQQMIKKDVMGLVTAASKLTLPKTGFQEVRDFLHKETYWDRTLVISAINKAVAEQPLVIPGRTAALSQQQKLGLVCAIVLQELNWTPEDFAQNFDDTFSLELTPFLLNL